MSRIMFIDTETNCLDTQYGFIMELGWAIYDIDSKRLIKTRSYMLKWNMGYTVDEGAFEATGLTREFCEANGWPAQDVFAEFLVDCAEVECVCGHNFIDFDKNMLISNIKRVLFGDPVQFTSLFTFDTMYDCPFPKNQKSLALKYLALDHDYILSDAHQALADVFACAAIFFKYDFEEIMMRARTPIVTISGLTEYLDTDGRAAFYKQKFRWNREKRRWEKRCRAFYVDGAQLELGNYNLFCDDKLLPKEKRDEEIKILF